MADDEPTVPAPASSSDAAAAVEQVSREFSTKFGSIQQQVGALTQAVSGLIEQRQPPPPAAPRPGVGPAATDDELWERAKAGDKDAFDTHQARKSAQIYQQLRGQEKHQELVTGQLDILKRKYPVLSDPQHQLTQTANAAYTLLTRRGYPATPATYLESLKTAIADRPDLVAEMQTQGARASEGARRASAGRAGTTGATYRQQEFADGSGGPASPGSVRVTAEQTALAKRMNVADPKKAIERFLKRQENGESRFGAVGGMLQDQGEF